MLFKQIHLKGIREGTVSLAFRRWKKAAAKPGSLIKTAVGLVEILKVTVVTEQHIKAADARKAGFDSLEELMQMLHQYTDGDYYRIEVRYHTADPRIVLREQDTLTDTDYRELQTKLDRLDRYSKIGNWTMEVLEAIQMHPKLRAADLALEVNKTKDWLKLNVRKLKNLGLTISHEPGYEISPLGLAFLAKAKKDK